jgi:hypothetical protein
MAEGPIEAKRESGRVANPWKRGLPPGKYYDGMVDDFEVAFAPLAKWHRRRSPEEAASHRAARLAREESK